MPQKQEWRAKRSAPVQDRSDRSLPRVRPIDHVSSTMPVGESISVSPVISTPVAPIIEDHVAASSPAQPISTAST